MSGNFQGEDAEMTNAEVDQVTEGMESMALSIPSVTTANDGCMDEVHNSWSP